MRPGLARPKEIRDAWECPFEMNVVAHNDMREARIELRDGQYHLMSMMSDGVRRVAFEIANGRQPVMPEKIHGGSYFLETPSGFQVPVCLQRSMHLDREGWMFTPMQIVPARLFPLQLLDAILGGVSDQLAHTDVPAQEFAKVQDECTRRVQTQVDFIIDEIIRENWREPPPKHPFWDDEMCDMLLVICRKSIDRLGPKLARKRLGLFLESAIADIDATRRSTVVGILEKALYLEGDEAMHWLVRPIHRAGRPNSRQRIPVLAPSVSRLDSATRRKIIAGIEETTVAMDIMKQTVTEFERWTKLPLTQEQIGWAELQLQREVSESDLQKAVNEVVNGVEAAVTRIAWSYVSEFLDQREGRNYNLQKILRDSVAHSIERILMIIRHKETCRTGELLGLVRFVDDHQRKLIR
jgi:hypothetical protein